MKLSLNQLPPCNWFFVYIQTYLPTLAGAGFFLYRLRILGQINQLR
ncbi:hypothetical protein SRABI96_00682 [Peribacillus sp. Bi96]|nr:hypothetical protein SRABI96_00682 [Peribacillus sp. Bi96]